MATENERKFLLKNDDWRELQSIGKTYRQGYINSSNGLNSVRVRICENEAYLTIKGKNIGISRTEFEYAIPKEEAEIMLEQMCDRPLIEKTRYEIQDGDLIWEIDEFSGENQGLIVAEIELTDPEQIITLPPWIGLEVSNDSRYFNVNLTKYPFNQW